ncbi:MAG: hypothetical protein IT167_10790 [Bryobacterales bacterium]|nr:hypothetical protein [Bryobacterales bacterium]
MRFLRKHLGFSGDELGSYLHTDRTKVSKWERDEDPIGQANDRLVRLLTAALDKEMRPAIAAIAEHLPSIADDLGKKELHVDVATLQTSFVRVSKAEGGFDARRAPREIRHRRCQLPSGRTRTAQQAGDTEVFIDLRPMNLPLGVHRTFHRM